MSTLTDKQLEDLYALVLRMSPGDWVADPDGYGRWGFEGGYLGILRTSLGFKVYSGPGRFQALRGSTEEEAQANAEGIAALKTQALALLDEIRLLRSLQAERDKRWSWHTPAPPETPRLCLCFCGTRLGYLWSWGTTVVVEIHRSLRQKVFSRDQHDDPGKAALEFLRDEFGTDVPTPTTPIPDLEKCA